jgi:hypothetical protein
MKARSLRPSAVIFLAVATSLSGSFVSAAPTRAVHRGAALRSKAAARSLDCGPAAPGNYTVEVPIVTRVVGTALFRTALDISNNTASGTSAVPVVARLQYSYNRVNSDHSLSFFRTPDPTSPRGQPLNINLLAFDNFHTDDIIQYLGNLDLLEPGAAQNSFGTLLVTFENLPSAQGWEGAVFARTYSPNPTGGGTVAIAYPASLFFESASQTLVATIRDTQTSPSDAGALRTNIGIRNTDIRCILQDVTVEVTFYDVTAGSPTNGQRVGAALTLTLRSGEVKQLNNIRAMAGIPDNVTAMLAFVDVLGASATGPTIEGYVNILDGGTQDGAFFEMKCADTDGCDN